MDYGEPWWIEPAMEKHYSDRNCINARGGVVGNYFSSYSGELEERAVLCVNALKGVPNELLAEPWFQKLMVQFSKGDYETEVRKAYSAIRTAAQAAEVARDKSKQYERKLRFTGRVAGLRAAMRMLEKTPAVRDAK